MSVRSFYWVAGAFFLLVGIVGYVVPGVPGTFPIICSAYFFGKADPRMERWLLHHRWFGPSLRRWRETGGLSLRAKSVAVCMILLSSGFSMGFVPMPPVAVVSVAVVALGAILYLLTRPSIES
jgi:uncharacterized membrane protein YbaN (DUF454 family)